MKIDLLKFRSALILMLLLMTACSPKEPDLMEMDKWDLVVISDSSGWGVGEHLAALIETDLGKTVEVTDLAISNLTAVQALNAAEGKPSPHFRLSGLPDLIANSEVFVINVSPAESESASNPSDWDCIYPIGKAYVNSCTAESFEQYTSDLQAIIDKILILREGKPTVIRFFSYWLRVDWFIRDGALQECLQCTDNLFQSIEKAGSKYDIPVANIMDAFNGPNHELDPNEAGYIGEDNAHTSEIGQELLAESIHSLGYNPVKFE